MKHGDYEVRGIGTSWLRRGPDYWLARLLTLSQAGLAAMLPLIIFGLWQYQQPPSWPKYAALAAVVAVTGAYTWLAARRPLAERDWLAGVLSRRGVLVLLVGAVLVAYALAGTLLPDERVALWVVLVPLGLSVGPLLAFLAGRLSRELPAERLARIATGLPAPGDPARAAAVRAVEDDLYGPAVERPIEGPSDAALPFYGTTWLLRGSDYWVRRVTTTLASAFLAFQFGAMGVIVVIQTRAFPVGAAALGVALAAFAIVATVRGSRALRGVEAGGPVPRRPHDPRGQRVVGWAGWAMLVALAAAVVIFGFDATDPVMDSIGLGLQIILGCGAFAVFAATLRPELPFEKRMRLRLELPPPDDPGRAEAVEALQARWSGAATKSKVKRTAYKVKRTAYKVKRTKPAKPAKPEANI